jgi:hypothetical protein
LTAITLHLWLGTTMAELSAAPIKSRLAGGSFLGVLSAERVFDALQIFDVVATMPITLYR